MFESLKSPKTIENGNLTRKAFFPTKYAHFIDSSLYV